MKKYDALPRKVSQKAFNRYVDPYLSRARHGPPGKISRYKIFNYILFVLYTGIQWRELRTYKNELHWSNIYKWHYRWSRDGSYENLFLHSVEILRDEDKLDLSILHGDGANTLAKKGAKESAIRGTSTRKEKKRLP